MLAAPVPIGNDREKELSSSDDATVVDKQEEETTSAAVDPQRLQELEAQLEARFIVFSLFREIFI